MRLLKHQSDKELFYFYPSFFIYSSDLFQALEGLTHFILMDFPKHVDRVSMELPILYFKGSQVEISKF